MFGTSKYYFNIFSRHHSVKLYHVICKVKDAQLFTHIQYIDFAAASHDTGLYYKLRGFRNCHEIALHVRVSDIYRTSGSYLLLKQRHNASPAAKHVAQRAWQQGKRCASVEGADKSRRSDKDHPPGHEALFHDNS